jgi:hypothetical protein
VLPHELAAIPGARIIDVFENAAPERVEDAGAAESRLVLTTAQKVAEAGSPEAVEIAGLAALSPLDYDRDRKAAAKRLGISRVAALDQAVEAARPGSEKDGGGVEANGRNSQALHLADIEPWPESVDGVRLLSNLAHALQRFVVLGEHEANATALWTVATHAMASGRFFRGYWSARHEGLRQEHAVRLARAPGAAPVDLRRHHGGGTGTHRRGEAPNPPAR